MKANFDRMRSSTLFGAATATLLLGLAACAHDPAKDLKSAETELTSAQATARSSMNQLDAKQANERAKTAEKGQAMVDDAQKNMSDASAAFTKDRKDFTSGSKGSLDQLDATASNLKMKAGSLAPDKKGEFDALWGRYQAQRKDVTAQIGNLDNVPTEGWNTSKDGVTGSLKDLSDTVSKLGKLF